MDEELKRIYLYNNLDSTYKIITNATMDNLIAESKEAAMRVINRRCYNTPYVYLYVIRYIGTAAKWVLTSSLTEMKDYVYNSSKRGIETIKRFAIFITSDSFNIVAMSGKAESDIIKSEKENYARYTVDVVNTLKKYGKKKGEELDE